MDGPLGSLISQGLAPIWVQGGGGGGGRINFKHFSCAQIASPGAIFYNNELVFAPLETKKIKKTVKNIPNGNLVFQKILAMDIF